jgi:hypothetical protein
LCGYDSENASKEIENYDKMKSMLECHAASGDSEDFDIFNSNVDMGDVDMCNGFEENNIDSSSYDAINYSNSDGSNSNSDSNNNSSGKHSTLSTHTTTTTTTTSNTHTHTHTPSTLHHNHQTKYNSVCPAIMRRLRDLDIVKNQKSAASRKNSHDWEIKMLLTPESPPDTPRV